MLGSQCRSMLKRLIPNRLSHAIVTEEQRLPVLLLTGFLGSGKTTVLNSLLRQEAMRESAVAINEFGETGLDDKFIDHEGFDWEGIQKAMEKNEKKGRIVAGGSTISQQLAKNLFLSASKTPWRKAQEAVITLMLETLWDKRRILEVYLNVVEWGEGIFGAEAAAKRYFGSNAARLGPEQAARLAVMLPAPRRFEKNPYSNYLNGRTQLILGRMYYATVPQ